MLPRLQADESFLAAERIAIGTGSVSESASRDVTRAWRRAQGGGSRGAAAVKATPPALRQLGIRERRVPQTSGPA